MCQGDVQAGAASGSKARELQMWVGRLRAHLGVRGYPIRRRPSAGWPAGWPAVGMGMGMGMRMRVPGLLDE